MIILYWINRNNSIPFPLGKRDTNVGNIESYQELLSHSKIIKLLAKSFPNIEKLGTRFDNIIIHSLLPNDDDDLLLYTDWSTYNIIWYSCTVLTGLVLPAKTTKDLFTLATFKNSLKELIARECGQSEAIFQTIQQLPHIEVLDLIHTRISG